MNTKKTYDLRINSRGNVQAMTHGFFEKCHEMVYTSHAPFPTDDYVEIELPSCIYRVHKRDVNCKPFVKYIERAREHQTNEH